MKITKKLPGAMAVLSILAAVITGGISYFETSVSEHKRVNDNLMHLADTKMANAKEFFATAQNQLEALAQSPQILNAYDKLSYAYYELGPDAEGILQKSYIDDNQNPFGEKDKLISANNSTKYDAIHKEIHPWMRSILKTNDFYDIFLFDTQGRNIYTVFKERDFATQLANGRWKDSGLGELVRKVIKEGASAKPMLADFTPYSPSNNVPAGFIAMPLKSSDGKFIGIIAIQLSIGKLDNAMGLHR